MPLVRPAYREPNPAPPSMTRRAFVAGGALALAAYAATHGRHQLEVLDRTLSIPNLPDGFVGMRIVQISDLHLEEYTEAWYLERVVAAVNALNPEIVLITGDFVSYGPRAVPFAWKTAGLCADILSGLKAPQRYAVLGNHDVAVGQEHVIPPVSATGIQFLVDSHVALERGGDRLWLCGTNDATRAPDLKAALPAAPRAPVLLMCHEPDFADFFAVDPLFQQVDVMLSGHSHGGQVRLPLIGPLVLPPLGKKYVEGHFQLGRTQLYVNRGIGTVGLPFRLHCPSEITHFTLARA